MPYTPINSTESRQKTLAVVDGMGGGIGVQLVSGLRQALGERVTLIALGTNAIATERMVKAGADSGATGENAIVRSIGRAGMILGPVGIIIGNSMMGEITCNMAQAILDADAFRIVLPLQNDHFTLAGIDGLPLAKMIEKAIALAKEHL
ncbi:MAG: DUF3842 family protein [Termitinemataceae bacterium]|nr:MAG: DUF3842 family protein [Termitinemataceae bacterium]